MPRGLITSEDGALSTTTVPPGRDGIEVAKTCCSILSSVKHLDTLIESGFIVRQGGLRENSQGVSRESCTPPGGCPRGLAYQWVYVLLWASEPRSFLRQIDLDGPVLPR